MDPELSPSTGDDPVAETNARSMGASFAAHSRYSDTLTICGLTLRGPGGNGYLIIGSDDHMAEARDLRRMAWILLGAADVLAAVESVNGRGSAIGVRGLVGGAASARSAQQRAFNERLSAELNAEVTTMQESEA